MSLPLDLLRKYDVPAPRYTSYPTVPYWESSPTTGEWVEALHSAFVSPKSRWSMYIHVPFCETLCTFCGCNTTITKDHKRESPYVQQLLQEWETYKDTVPELLQREMMHVHLGGGTPTFLSPEQLTALMTPILSSVVKGQPFEASIEVDPRRTTDAHLVALRELGFDRVSLGVQDFDPEVQRIVNRVQPLEETRRITEKARELGFHSVNFDLIYGLPKQTLESIADMVAKTVELRPDRIAFYSFALVPWIKPAQRLFKDEDVPMGETKREFYELGRRMLLEAGYQEIGMDHFALPTDGLSRAQNEHRLHRNFMGYTDQRTEVMIGLGVSSISESPTCFHQNEKILTHYESKVEQGEIPTLRGHKLTDQDRKQRAQILKLMTEWQVVLHDEGQLADVKQFLASMIEDGLVEIQGTSMSVTEKGRPFLRNACMALDLRLRQKMPNSQVFSKAL
jgi:oxygen-independent coproporphyrinogen-3 oxidase